MRPWSETTLSVLRPPRRRRLQGNAQGNADLQRKLQIARDLLAEKDAAAPNLTYAPLGAIVLPPFQCGHEGLNFPYMHGLSL